MENNLDQITINIPLSWLIKFCTHIDFAEPMTDDERRDAWIQKIKDQFGVDIKMVL